MLHLISKWFISAIAILLAAYLIPGIAVASFYTALVVAVLLGLINAVIKPFLIILTLPINILTLGLFTFVINGLLFWFLSTFVRGFEVSGFLAAIVGAMTVSVFGYLGNKFVDAIENNNHSVNKI